MNYRDCLIIGGCETRIYWDGTKREYRVKGCICIVEGDAVDYFITESERERVGELDELARQRLRADLVVQHQGGVKLLMVADALVDVNKMEL